ncbi:hypothetical protein Tsubulata_011776 [Turnera subulata]|uniref:AMP-activated protein kinase glycogen-binding domain-containing protein n=1 Tax=Turnera subulata TaxID=218843 RepID=A0A9Q0GFD1_9ROSI|nr:hypothetical protein Tsubulata_011776 [Turnera subulata]
MKPSIHEQTLIRTMITWDLPGNDVEVIGSWDNWRCRRKLNNFQQYIVLELMPGVYQYNYIVDGVITHNPHIPAMSFENGVACNVLVVVPENSEENVDFLDELDRQERPPSPDSSYGNEFPGEQFYQKPPPEVPSQLLHPHLVIDRENADGTSTSGPHYVLLNHLLLGGAQASDQSARALGLISKVESKVVSFSGYYRRTESDPPSILSCSTPRSK